MDEEDLEPHMQELKLGGSYRIWHAQIANERINKSDGFDRAASAVRGFELKPLLDM